MGIDWDGIKRAFETGGEPMSSLASRYGCHKDSIRRKAKLEGWKKGEDRGQEREGRASSGKSEAGLTDRHMVFWRGVERRLARGLKTKDIKQGLEELKVAKMAGEVISSMIRSKRLELGMGEGLGEDETEQAQAAAAEMARVTASPGADEALD